MFSSLYPNLTIEFNIAPNTQIGKITIPNKIYSDENHYNNDKYDRAGEYIENFATDCIVEFCHRWLHLANFEEFLQDWNEYNQKFVQCFSNYGQYMRFYRPDKLEENINSKWNIVEIPIKQENKVKSPIFYLDPGQKAISPIIVLNKLPNKGVQYNGYYAGTR